VNAWVICRTQVTRIYVTEVVIHGPDFQLCGGPNVSPSLYT